MTSAVVAYAAICWTNRHGDRTVRWHRLIYARVAALNLATKIARPNRRWRIGKNGRAGVQNGLIRQSDRKIGTLGNRLSLPRSRDHFYKNASHNSMYALALRIAR